MKHYLFISIFAIYFCAVGCITVSYTPTFKDAQAQYNPARTDIHPEFLVQIKNDSTANVMVRILSSELLFTRANIENKAKAQIGINCAVYSDVEKRVLFDTLSVFQEFVQTKMPYTSSVIRLRIKPNSKQLALVVIQDITRRSEWSGYIEINSRPDFGAQRLSSTWAKISNTPESNTEQLNFYNWVPSESIVRIYAQSGVKMRSFLSYYALPLEVSPPPFAPYSPAVDPLKPDTTLFLTTGDFAPTEKGFYFFHLDSARRLGLGVSYFGANYPDLKLPSELIAPLEYIATSEEFSKLAKAENKKLALDEFWIGLGKDYGKAKQLIRIFYTRARFANIYFSSITQGWASDRGMIFLVFGPPEIIQRFNWGERWLYGSGKNLRTISFDFKRANNPYCINQYTLERSITYRHSWMLALEAWRAGKVYSGEEPIIPKEYETSKEIK